MMRPALRSPTRVAASGALTAGRRDSMPVEHLPNASPPRLLLRLRSDPLARHDGEDRLAELRQQPGALRGALHVVPADPGRDLHDQVDLGPVLAAHAR